MQLCVLCRQVGFKQAGSSRENMASRETGYPAGNRLYPLAKKCLQSKQLLLQKVIFDLVSILQLDFSLNSFADKGSVIFFYLVPYHSAPKSVAGSLGPQALGPHTLGPRFRIAS